MGFNTVSLLQRLPVKDWLRYRAALLKPEIYHLVPPSCLMPPLVKKKRASLLEPIQEGRPGKTPWPGSQSIADSSIYMCMTMLSVRLSFGCNVKIVRFNSHSAFTPSHPFSPPSSLFPVAFLLQPPLLTAGCHLLSTPSPHGLASRLSPRSSSQHALDAASDKQRRTAAAWGSDFSRRLSPSCHFHRSTAEKTEGNTHGRNLYRQTAASEDGKTNPFICAFHFSARNSCGIQFCLHSFVVATRYPFDRHVKLPMHILPAGTATKQQYL